MRKNFVVLLLLISSVAVAQEFTEKYELEKDYARATLGFGIGMDFGGFGARLTISPAKSVGLFAGVGYNLVGFGFNGGARFRLVPDKRVNPTLLAMYGYNGVIKVINADQYDKSYNGFTIGGGIQLNSKKSLNYWSFELLIPFRSQQFYDDLDTVSSNPGIEMSDPLPIAISIGYHLSI
ncbi:MAG: hypothetical protein QM762_28580 [Chryseolinea sp.]